MPTTPPAAVTGAARCRPDPHPPGDRWRSCVHESCHALIARNDGVPVLAMVLSADGAYMQHAPCDEFRAAAIAAGGLVADELLPLLAAAGYGPPAATETDAGSGAATPATPAARELRTVVLVARPSGGPGDLGLVREWAAPTQSEMPLPAPHPEDWGVRAALLLGRARTICTRELPTLGRLARALYDRAQLDEAAIASLVDGDCPCPR